MSRIYIDYIHAKPNTTNGGANYARAFVEEIRKAISNGSESQKVTIIWPEGYESSIPVEQDFEKNFDIVKCRKVEDCNFEEKSVLFIPLLGTKDIGLIKRLKCASASLKIIVTIHGVRFIDAKCDLYDLKYYISLRDKTKYIIKQMITRPIKLLYYKHVLSNNLRECEFVITVSNDSLNKIANISKGISLVPQYQKSYFFDFTDELSKIDDRYILFVSGNREIKNLARSIDAFKQYLITGTNCLNLYITGVSGSTREALINNLHLTKLVEEKKIVFYPYLNDSELASLFYNAHFLLYTSKSEGFGLPAIEAAFFNCPTVASYGTAIPEVLGSAALYVDPYSVDSIKNGIELMENAERNMMYRRNLQRILPILKEKSQIDYITIIDRIFQLITD